MTDEIDRRIETLQNMICDTSASAHQGPSRREIAMLIGLVVVSVTAGVMFIRQYQHSTSNTERLTSIELKLEETAPSDVLANQQSQFPALFADLETLRSEFRQLVDELKVCVDDRYRGSDHETFAAELQRLNPDLQVPQGK